MTTGIDLIKGLTILYAGSKHLPDQTGRILDRVAAEVRTASTTAEALAGLDGDDAPDIALLDIDALAKTGQGPQEALDLAVRIRERHPAMPIIMSAADPGRDVLLRAISIGTARFITNPMNEADLIEVLALSAAGTIQQRAADKDYSLTRRILDHSPDYVIITDGDNVNFVNRPLLDVVGCSRCTDIPTCEILEQSLELARKESVTDCTDFARWLRTAIGDPLQGAHRLSQRPRGGSAPSCCGPSAWTNP